MSIIDLVFQTGGGGGGGGCMAPFVNLKSTLQGECSSKFL